MKKILEFRKLYAALVVIILALVPFHAFISVWGGTSLGGEVWWKSWKEIFLLGLWGLSVVALVRDAGVRAAVLGSWVVRLMVVFALLHGVMVAVFGGSLAQVAAGLAVDLRFFAMFVAGQVAVMLWPGVRRWS